MEKTVDEKLNKKQSQDLNELDGDGLKNKEDWKTIIKEDLIKMKGDPLGLVRAFRLRTKRKFEC